MKTEASEALYEVKDTVHPDELAGLRLFAQANLPAVAALLADCPVKVLSQNEALLTPGGADRVLYLVLRGSLRVHLDSPETEPVQFIEAGEAVGESALANRKSMSAYVVADAPTRVLVIEPETFWSLVYAEHAVARNMLTMIIERVHANNALVAERLRRREQQRRQTRVDALTGLRNRAALVDLLRRQMRRSAMGEKPLAVMMMDIDHFRRFTWEFGHPAGEEVLYTVAQIIQDQVRPTDIAARLDGDHRFVIILPDCDEQGARGVAQRLAEEVSKAVMVMPDESILPPMTVSIGIAEMRAFAQAEELLAVADYALVRARARGCGVFSS